MSEFPELGARHRAAPAGLIIDPEDYEDHDLGPLKTGKEAEVFLVERVAADGRACILAHKRYRPRRVTTKGELAALGFQRANSFVNDHAYRHGRRMAKSRDQRAIERMTGFGRELLTGQWAQHEFEVLSQLWAAGVRVPYPVSLTDDGVLMEYLGDHDGAAPRLAQARLTPVQAQTAADQLRANLHRMVEAGFVHADLSAYNLLWWNGELCVIDLPQSVDIAANPNAIDLLHRDLRNVGEWFTRQRVTFDPEAELVDLLSSAFGSHGM